MGCPWVAHGLSVAIPWVVHGLPTGCPWTVRGLPMGCPWNVRGSSMGFPWAVRAVSVGCPWVAHGLSVGRPWALCPMGCPCRSIRNTINVGLFNVATRNILRPRCARGESRPPAKQQHLLIELFDEIYCSAPACSSLSKTEINYCCNSR